MKASYITNLLLLLVVVALVWFVQKPEPEQKPVQTMTDLAVTDVRDIQIQRHEKPPLHIQKQTQNWQIISPFQAQANVTRLNMILKLLKMPVQTRLDANDKNLAEYGLASPAIILQLNDKKFAFGDVETLSKQRYVLHQQQILLISDSATPMLRATADSFIDNRLLPADQKIRRIDLPAEQGNALSLTKTNGQWQSDVPSLSSDDMMALIDSWQHAYALQVHHLDAAALATLPEAEVFIWLENSQTPLAFVLLETENSLSLINPASALKYEFPTALKQQLFSDSKAE